MIEYTCNCFASSSTEHVKSDEWKPSSHRLPCVPLAPSTGKEKPHTIQHKMTRSCVSHSVKRLHSLAVLSLLTEGDTTDPF